MVSVQGKRGQGIKGGSGARGHPHRTYCKRMGHVQNNCYSLRGFPDKTVNVSKSEVVEPKFFLRNIKNI